MDLADLHGEEASPGGLDEGQIPMLDLGLVLLEIVLGNGVGLGRPIRHRLVKLDRTGVGALLAVLGVEREAPNLVLLGALSVAAMPHLEADVLEAAEVLECLRHAIGCNAAVADDLDRLEGLAHTLIVDCCGHGQYGKV